MAYADSIKVYFYLSGSWTDVSSDVLAPVSAKGGMGNRPTDLLADVGTLTFQLNNSTGKYSPDGSSPLAGWGLGIPVKVVVVYEGVSYVKAKAYVSQIQIDPGIYGPRRVSITASDWMNYATKYPLVTPEIALTQTADQAIDTIVTAMPIQPQATDYDTGVQTFPTVFDAVGTKTTAYSEMARLINSELGHLFLKRDKTTGETLKFENANARSGLITPTKIPKDNTDAGKLLMEDGTYLLMEDGSKLIMDETETVAVSNSMMAADVTHGDNVINRFTATAHPKRVDTELVVLYTAQRPFLIGPGETKTWRVNYSDPLGGRPVNAISSTMIQPQAPGTDPYIQSLLHMDGADASTTFTDEVGKTWTAHGNAQIDTATFEFGTASGNFDGTGDYIDTPSHADFNFGSGDFTVEWWERRDAATTGKVAISRDFSSSYPSFALGVSDGTNSNVYFTSTGTSWDIGPKSMGAISVGTWTHYAVSRQGNTWYTFRNGQLISTWTSSITILTNSNAMTIGGLGGGNYFNGHIDEFRVSKGIARYTANFTPPTVAFSYPATIGGDFTANTSETGDGTDISSDITISAVYGSESIIYTASNANAAPAYLTVQARGFGVYQFDAVEANSEDSASYNEFGFQTDSINQPYQQDVSTGKIFADAVVDAERQPRTVLNHISMNANRSGSAMEAFLNIDTGDLVQVTETQTGVSGLYYVNGWDFTINYNGIINYGWTLRQFPSLQSGLTAIGLEFDASSTDSVDFGVIPYILDQSRRSVSVWTYFSAGSGGNLLVLGGSDRGFQFYLDTSHRVTVESDSFATFATFRGTAISSGAWHHVGFTYDLENGIAAVPVIYIDGASVAVTTVVAPTGARVAETGCVLNLGNIQFEGYNGPLSGKMKDAKIFNRILTAAEFVTLYNGGTPSATVGPTDGLVFQAPNVRTPQLAEYTDVALSASQKVIDNVFGVVGTPHGTPTGRAF